RHGRTREGLLADRIGFGQSLAPRNRASQTRPRNGQGTRQQKRDNDMPGIALLVAVTIFYAGYNLLIKVSGIHVPAAATTTILATIWLQVAALLASTLFLGFLALQGGQVFSLSPRAYLWAALAGLCAGSAEITYFYLLSGVGFARPMAASIVIPTVVSGT